MREPYKDTLCFCANNTHKYIFVPIIFLLLAIFCDSESQWFKKWKSLQKPCTSCDLATLLILRLYGYHGNACVLVLSCFMHALGQSCRHRMCDFINIASKLFTA